MKILDKFECTFIRHKQIAACRNPLGDYQLQIIINYLKN